MDCTDELLLFLAGDAGAAMDILPRVRDAAEKGGPLRRVLGEGLMEYDALLPRLRRMLAARGLAGAPGRVPPRMWAFAGLELEAAAPGGDRALANLMAHAVAMGAAELHRRLRRADVFEPEVLAAAQGLLALHRDTEARCRRLAGG